MTQYSRIIKLIGDTAIGSLIDCIDKLLKHSDPKVVELANEINDLLSKNSEYQQISGGGIAPDGEYQIWIKEDGSD